MAQKPKTEVSTVEESSQLPAEFMNEIMNDAGAGVNNLGMDDIAVPYLYMLQSNSPQINPDHEKYVKDAIAGMFFNNVEEEVYDGRNVGVTVVPCAYERKFVEWIDRDSGGGWVQDHPIDSNILGRCKPDEKGRPHLANGNIVVETAYHYVYFLNPIKGTWDQIIIPMKSTALKKSRRWNKTLMQTLIPGTSLKAPRWLYPYNLKTTKEVKGTNTYSNFDMTRLDKPVDPDMYRAAKSFAKLFEEGKVIRADETVVDAGGETIDHDTDGGGSNGGVSEGMKEAMSSRGGKDELPF